jgi:hypothetical protein
MARCTRCTKLITDPEAQVSLERLRDIAHKRGKPEGELVNKHYPLCRACTKKLADSDE